MKRPKAFRPRALPAARPHDGHRGSARERGYTPAWDREARRFRREHPLCQYCAAGAFGQVRSSSTTRVDHLYPQRRFADVFWVTAWWVASCDSCDAAKQALEHKPQPALDQLARLLGRPVLQAGGV